MARQKNKRFRGHETKAHEVKSHKQLSWKASWEKKLQFSSQLKDQDASSSSSLSETAASTSSSVCDGSESDIPGFYYDKEKKAYFKILPNTMSGVSSFVTKESIKCKENEEQRLADMKQYLRGQSTLLQTALFTPSEIIQRNSSLTEVLQKFQCGRVTCENFRSYINKHRCSTLQPELEIINPGPHQNSPKLDSLQKLLTTSSRDYLICAWSLKSSIAQCVQLLSVSDNFRSLKPNFEETEAPKSFKAIKSLIVTQPIFKKISSLCWAKLPNNEASHTVLYTATCPIGYSPTIVYASNFDITTNSSTNVYELNLGFKTVWSCAWHNFDSKFSVGAERKCHLVDMATRRTWTYYTHNSDPLSQTFSITNPHKMYNGTRGGSIIVHDIRCPGNSRSQKEMRQKHGISCLRLLHDENYIMANDFSGAIMNWDQRMNRIVRKYKGLVNSHYQLPFYLDELESVVCGAGSDSYSKLWDVQTGTILQSIPPPCPAAKDSFPISIYAQGWGNSQGNSGLIMGIKNLFKVYC
ncbi:DDB1- and CUL4-associated factor 4-like [Elysia marginata]|uniref:DDB1- and CUL4-associated factor 4-like n=1 Tax=Elysia marginata TaxID=1093978 RepID=A0AAV4JFR8_9GAST|nr:DDB1- and CUL4-associated factor 4-like [Elysia marginata]